jgi:hypothetical protein
MIISRRWFSFRRWVRLAFVLLMIVDLGCPANVSAGLQRPDCPICGHVCCCPEMCASKLNAAKKTALCRDSSSPCRLQSREAGFTGATKEISARPPVIASGAVADLHRPQAVRRQADDPIGFIVFPLDVPTPPPRRFLV